jgi:hypothetical protein
MECGGADMLLKGLRQILEEVDMFISQHTLYISKLERAIRNCGKFDHKTCHQCNFGLMWDSTVVPIKDELPEEARALVEEIEKIHCEFHEVSRQIDPKDPQPSDEERLNRMRELSTLPVQKLLALKRLVREG